MASEKFPPGGLIRAVPNTPAIHSAGGVWQLEHVLNNVANTLWPGSAAATITHTASASSATNATGHTFSSTAIGTASAGRWILVGVGKRGAATIDSVTLGGVAMTALGSQHDDTGALSTTSTRFYIIFQPTGTTADIVTAYSTTVGAAFISVWALTNISAPTSPVDVDTTGADATAVTVDVKAGGVVAAIAGSHNSGTTTYTWTNVTERFDTALDTDYTVGGGDATTAADGTLAVTADAATTPDSISVHVISLR